MQGIENCVGTFPSQREGRLQHAMSC